MENNIIEFTETDKPKEVTCNFCRKKYNPEKTKVIESNDKAICEHCVRRCKALTS